MRLAFAAIARPTFDLGLAQEVTNAALAVIVGLDHDAVGSATLLTDEAAVIETSEQWADLDADALVVLQSTFADSTAVAALAASTAAPIVLWAFPEDRTGGRLRLNSLCGINLAAYRLRREGRDYRWLLRSPSDPKAPDDLRRAVRAGWAGAELPPAAQPSVESRRLATAVANRLAHARIGIIGERPTGFEPCDHDPVGLRATLGVTSTAIPLPHLFQRAENSDPHAVAELRAELATELSGVDELDAEAVDRSLQLHLGLRDVVRDERLDAIATRCWPECFTEFGAAACTPQSMLTEAGVPACCEADAYGATTGLILQMLGESPVFIADLVHLDRTDNTAVFWHCGLAPISLADPLSIPRATVHSNRQKPLLDEFPLRPGRITVARLSQSAGQQRLVVGGADMLRAPLAFSGTAGVARLDRSVDDVLDSIMSEGLEHHYGIAYGDLRAELRALATELGLPVVEL